MVQVSSKTRAKFYIYRNLHKDCFSVKHKGRIIGHHKNIIAAGVTFKVSEAGRARVLKERKKYVHAYVVADSYMVAEDIIETTTEHPIYEEAYYNPYQQDTFTVKGKPVHKAEAAWLTSICVGS